MIYLVEDDDNIRKLVSYALNKEGYETAGFAAPEEFWQAISKEVPELIMLDIMLPGEDGLSILKKLRSQSKTEAVPIIMLTAKDSEFDKVTGLDLGADDYLTKPFGMTELTARVRALLRRAQRDSGKHRTYQIGTLFVDPEKHIIRVGSQDITLSYKEYSLLLVLLEAGGRVVGRGELLTRVWGEYYDESRTLDVHIRRLRAKLGDDGHLIRTVKNIGYQIGGNQDE